MQFFSEKGPCDAIIIVGNTIAESLGNDSVAHGLVWDSALASVGQINKKGKYIVTSHLN